MRLFFKALLVLVLLVPTLADAQTSDSFIRIQRDAKRDPVALQTAIAKYVAISGDKSVEIDLVAVVHIGEKAYYERLNKEFEKYDVVLYELVAVEGTKPPKGKETSSDNPLALLQQGMKFFLRLEHQLEVVDYHKPNFVHADLSLAGLRKAMKDRGDDEMTVVLGVILDFLRKQNQETNKPPSPDFDLSDLFDSRKLKRAMALQFEEAGGDAGLGKTINQLIVEDRNKACMRVLKQQLEAGKKKIAIFYGAAHMPDFDKRLNDELGMKRTTSEWVDAWNLK